MAQTPWVSGWPHPSPPSHPPSCQASHIITPVKSHPNYVRTNNNTRSSLGSSKEIPEGNSAAQSKANLDVEILDLVQGVPANEDLNMAQAIITQAVKEHKEVKAIKAKATI
ncbi:hypothetical protein KEM48_005858 [Puccinia striiformis f. sp. tritici PST-130]|nr:hypothetical protein KEM48_005858 [Puccinia striiformis f. sp. tritici PST-130]